MRKIPQNFVYPEIKETDYVFGAQQIIGNILRPDGDWRPYLPPGELQRRNGIESSSCYIEAQQHTIATILEEQFDIFDQNFSARFNAIFANGTKSGGDPLKAAQTFREEGLIPDTMLPFSDDITSWEEFRSFKGGDKALCESQGATWLTIWEPKYDIVVKREMDVETKYSLLKNALKYSPIPVSVYGQTDGSTYAKKPKGVSDTHLVELVYIDDKNCGYIWDTYEPFLKKLPANYNFDFGMRWTVERSTRKAQISIIQKALSFLFQLLNFKVAHPDAKPDDEVTELPVVPVVAPQPITEPHGSYLIEWATAIRDYEGGPGDLNYKNNNPGNLRSVKGPFLKFKTYEEGWGALLDYLTRAATGKHKAYKPEFTLQQFFSVYAPSADKNDPVAYANYVAKRIGVPDTTLIKSLV